MNVTLTFNAEELSAGTYEADIRVSSNDPDEYLVIAPTYFWVFAPEVKAI
jgi:hypothetical protein